jgi:hypothetical protein
MLKLYGKNTGFSLMVMQCLSYSTSEQNQFYNHF